MDHWSCDEPEIDGTHRWCEHTLTTTETYQLCSCTRAETQHTCIWCNYGVIALRVAGCWKPPKHGRYSIRNTGQWQNFTKNSFLFRVRLFILKPNPNDRSSPSLIQKPLLRLTRLTGIGMSCWMPPVCVFLELHCVCYATILRAACGLLMPPWTSIIRLRNAINNRA